MKFKLEIELGNDMMNSPTDVSVALLDIALQVRRLDELRLGPGPRGIKDDNGNSVGSWEVVDGTRDDHC